jgi:gliding motility-associated-like protein
VTATDENGCASTDSFTIGAIPAVTVGPDDLICDGLTASLVGSDRPGAWTFSSDDGTATFADAAQTDTEVTVSGFGVYTFDFHDTECDAHDQTVLTFLPSPDFYFPTDTFACLQGSLYLYPDGANASYFNWYWEDIDVENQGVVYNVTSLDSTFQWSATNACGTDQGTIRVLAELCEITIPNVFTPDGDDFNQSFEIVGIENFDGSSLQVFNRWGKMVYESSNYSNNWSPSEDEAADGVYYYVLGLNRNDGTEYFSGHVTLLRNPK